MTQDAIHGSDPEEVLRVRAWINSVLRTLQHHIHRYRCAVQGEREHGDSSDPHHLQMLGHDPDLHIQRGCRWADGNNDSSSNIRQGCREVSAAQPMDPDAVILHWSLS